MRLRTHGISKAKYAVYSDELLIYGFTRVNINKSNGNIPDLICFTIFGILHQYHRV